jgi:hypothetical protein
MPDEIHLEHLVDWLITANEMYHLCHVFYQQLPRNLPLAVNVFTNRKTSRILK